MYIKKDIYKSELNKLIKGVKNGNDPYHMFALSSLNGKSPESRTVVSRGITLRPLKIYFNADYRSPKVKELIKNPSCSALFYDQFRRVQLRFKCQAVIHYDDNLSKEVWENTALQSRKCYMAPLPPGELLEEWHPNIPSEYLKKDPDRKRTKEGYINFTHIELAVLESDVLQLHHDGHVRFKVKGDDIFYVSS